VRTPARIQDAGIDFHLDPLVTTVDGYQILLNQAGHCLLDIIGNPCNVPCTLAPGSRYQFL
jgi:hypothetical protein